MFIVQVAHIAVWGWQQMVPSSVQDPEMTPQPWKEAQFVPSLGECLAGHVKGGVQSTGWGVCT